VLHTCSFQPLALALTLSPYICTDTEGLMTAALAMARHGQHERARQFRTQAALKRQDVQDTAHVMPYQYALLGELGSLQ